MRVFDSYRDEGKQVTLTKQEMVTCYVQTCSCLHIHRAHSIVRALGGEHNCSGGQDPRRNNGLSGEKQHGMNFQQNPLELWNISFEV